MLALIIAFFAILFSCLSFGFFFLKLLKTNSSLIITILSGLAIITTISQLISLFHPLDGVALIFILLTGLALFISQSKSNYVKLTKNLKDNKFSVLLALPFLYIGFLISLEPPLHYDTGLYHFQFVLWHNKYPIVPGLANLHGRLGFNNAILCTHSVYNFVDIFKQPIFALNYFLFFIGTLYFIKTIVSNYHNNQNKIKFQNLANLLLFGGFLILAVDLSSPAPDYAANVILMIMVSTLFNQKPQFTLDWIPYLIISVFLITVKLSMIPVIFITLYGLYNLFKEEKKLFLITTLFALIVAAIWVLRNYILSGWLLYPFPHLNFSNPEWQVPANIVRSEADAIAGWARVPGMDINISSKLPFIEWFPVWWSRANYGKMYIILCLLSILVSFYIMFRNKIIKNYLVKVLITTNIVGFFFWFIMAPDFRFSIGFIFLTIVMPFYYLDGVFDTMPQKYNAILFVLLFFYLGLLTTKHFLILKGNAFPSWISGRYKLPKNLEYVGRQKMDSFQLRDVTFYFPYKSDVTKDFRCYDQCIPCIPTRDTGIGFLGSDLRDGFYRKINK
jgi:hypothetical protein